MASEIANFSPVKGQLSPTHGTLRLIMPPANSIAFKLFSPPSKKMILIIILKGIQKSGGRKNFSNALLYLQENFLYK